jgi:hypothetical protein
VKKAESRISACYFKNRFNFFALSLLPLFALFYQCEAQDLQTMQTSLSGNRGFLPKMSAGGMESGILDEFRLFNCHNHPALYFYFSLAAFLFWNVYEIK